MTNYHASYRFASEPDKRQMTLDYEGFHVVFRLSHSTDLPPAPVAHMRKRNTIPKTFIKKEAHSLDAELIKAEQEKVLQKALNAQKSLADKRAQEKKLLEAER